MLLRVDDTAIIAAMHLLLERAKLVVEPSGAAGLAAVLDPAFDPEGRYRRVGVVLSGGNLDVTPLLPRPLDL